MLAVLREAKEAVSTKIHWRPWQNDPCPYEGMSPQNWGRYASAKRVGCVGWQRDPVVLNVMREQDLEGLSSGRWRYLIDIGGDRHARQRIRTKREAMSLAVRSAERLARQK